MVFATMKHLLHPGNIYVFKEDNIENSSMESQEMIPKNEKKTHQTLCNEMNLCMLHGILDNNLSSQECVHLFSVYEHR